MGEDDVVNVVRHHPERGQFVRQRPAYTKPSSEGRVGRAGARVDQCQARRRADQEAMVKEVPRVNGELVRIPHREGL
jgi:hypothetical protein